VGGWVVQGLDTFYVLKGGSMHLASEFGDGKKRP
jgi:hypothetical protein